LMRVLSIWGRVRRGERRRERRGERGEGRGEERGERGEGERTGR
jgi:hypothetical protein